MPTTKSLAPRILLIMFSGMAVIFLTRGLTRLLPSSSLTNAMDLRCFWDELRGVLHHHSPYEIGYADHVSAYPAYAFVPNLLLYWPPWSMCRIYCAMIDLLCLAGIACWGYRQILSVDCHWAMAAGMSILAMSSINPCIGNGQNTIVYTAILLGSLALSKGSRPIAAGLLLGVAMSKISLALPFLLVFIFRGNWKIVLACIAFMLASTLAVALWVSSSPLEMIHLWIHRAEQHLGQGYDFSSLLICAGANFQIATRVAEALVLSAALTVFVFARNLPLLTLFGLAAGFGRLWTYHRLYDNFLLAILLIALAEVAFQTRRVSTFLTLAMFGLSLWVFTRSMDVPTVHIAHVLIWIAAMAVLCRDAFFLQRRGRQRSNSEPRDGLILEVPTGTQQQGTLTSYA